MYVTSLGVKSVERSPADLQGNSRTKKYGYKERNKEVINTENKGVRKY